MNIEELQAAWANTESRLEKTIQLNRQLLVAAKLGNVKTPIRGLTISLAVEAALAFWILLGLGSFIFYHRAEPLFLWPAVLLDCWMIALFAATVRQLVFIFNVDYGQPVVEIQRQLEQLRLLRSRVLRWALLTGQVVWWLPFFVVALRAFLGIDAYRVFGPKFFFINGLASGLLVPFTIWLANWLVRRTPRSPFLQSMAEAIEGSAVRRALRSLAEVAAFEQEVAA